MFSEVFDKLLKEYNLQEITNNNGAKIDNVKIDDIVKTPDGFVGTYIKKKEYAVIDLGDGNVKEAEIGSLQLVKPAQDKDSGSDQAAE